MCKRAGLHSPLYELCCQKMTAYVALCFQSLYDHILLFCCLWNPAVLQSTYPLYI